MMEKVRQWYYSLPLHWRKRFRKLIYYPTDLVTSRPSHIPAKGINFTGPGDFEKIGNEFFQYFRKWGNITPHSNILEIGCGMGRMALPFKNFLSEEGHFTGIDIVPEGIAWCREKIAPVDQRFDFVLADIRNDLYNPDGKTAAGQYTFPFAGNSFDLIFLTSVFTHLLPSATERYISEISRLLKPDGRMIATFFLLDTESQKLVRNKKSHFNFKAINAGYATISSDVPESNVAYEQDWLLSLLQQQGLSLAEPVKYGSWCGRKEHVSFQDIVIATK